MPHTGLEDQPPAFKRAWQRALVYFGLVDDRGKSSAATPHEDTAARLHALELRVDEQAREITTLRDELDRLGAR